MTAIPGIGRAVLIAAAFVLATLAAAPAAPAAPGSRFEVPASARQLIVVSSPGFHPPAYIATLRTFERTSGSSRWRQVFGPWPAETGYGHLRHLRHEGDGSTPTGTFGIGRLMYGIEPDPGGLHYAYHRLVCGDWWDEDPYSARYNDFVHVSCGVRPAFASWSEPLWTETVAYPYFAVVDFNTDPVRGGADAPGSGIFLHSWVGGATAGCVALHPAELLTVLRWLRPSLRPVIAIGTTAEVGALARR